jgi:phytoene dehydrogenase-like protein
VIRTLGEYCPNVGGGVEHVEVLAPPDTEARFGLVGGNIFQGEMTRTSCSASGPSGATGTTERR